MTAATSILSLFSTAHTIKRTLIPSIPDRKQELTTPSSKNKDSALIQIPEKNTKKITNIYIRELRAQLLKHRDITDEIKKNLRNPDIKFAENFYEFVRLIKENPHIRNELRTHCNTRLRISQVNETNSSTF